MRTRIAAAGAVPAVAGLLLVTAAAWPVTAAAAKTSKPAASPFKPASEFFDANGVRLRYLSGGRGETIVLLHGLHSTAYQSWQKTGILEALARNHRVLALDLPGHGESDKPAIPDAYGKAMVEDVRLLLDHVGVSKAHIVGYSLGALVATRFLVDHPDRVLSGTVAGMGWMRDSGWLQGVWERLPVREADNTSRMCIRSIEQLQVTRQELEAIQVPVAVILGDRDPVRRMYITPLKNARKDWPVIVVPGGGATAITTKKFRDELVKWLQRH
ncbi:MAG TPA: alpha/beta fold hydrolase [Candidatus Limnocylindrales bacterium]|nr:alpha/beta fold hydrolase [Candidatus Limnocylindrales bacterium]